MIHEQAYGASFPMDPGCMISDKIKRMFYDAKLLKAVCRAADITTRARLMV